MMTLSKAALLSLACIPFVSAIAADQSNNCKLKGGSMVQLAAEACVMEGGMATTATPVEPVVTNASLHLSADPKLADAQRAVADLLIKPVRDMNSKKQPPEGIERSVKFDGCRLAVDEDIHIDQGNLISARMNFKVSSTVDLRNISNDAYRVLGKVTSYGGSLQTYAVSFVEKHSGANNIAIAMLVQRKSGPSKYTLDSSGAYWDAPDDDLWMADEYGYPTANGMDGAATNKVRIVYFLNTAEDAAALKKALDDVHALCKQ
ncbi:MAG: hypothetical protein HKM01_07500 [Gallionella sp.]|nr:hypothetical protein [Gallionella sp.]